MSLDPSVERALREFCDVGEAELGRAPLSIPEEVESMSAQDIRLLRWGVQLLERDLTFSNLVAAADAAYLAHHRALMGQHSVRDYKGQDHPVSIQSLDQHLRCFFRTSGVYHCWLKARTANFDLIRAHLLSAINQQRVRVQTLVWFEGVSRPGRGSLAYGSGQLLGFDDAKRQDVVDNLRSLRLFFFDELPFDPTHLLEMELIEFVEERVPAFILGEVHAYHPTNFRLRFNFAASREAFPRRGWRADIDQKLDGLRIVDWHAHNPHGPLLDYQGPVLRSMVMLHDNPLFQPFEILQAKEALRETDFVNPDGDELEHPAYWLNFQDDRVFEETLSIASALASSRELVSAKEAVWSFVDQAFEYLRRSEDVPGYEQFVMLCAVMDCLLSKGKQGAKDFNNFMKRWARLSRPDATVALETQIAQNEKLYDLRSRYVHGDLGRDAVISTDDLITINQNVRNVLRRFLIWLSTLKNSGAKTMPSKKGILAYLDAFDDESQKEDVLKRFEALRNTPHDLATL